MESFSLDKHALFTFLENQKLNPLIEKDSGLVYILLKGSGDHTNTPESPLFFVIRNEHTLLQMINYLPFQLKDHLKEEIARLLHLLNKDLDLPGFGMDEDQGLIFYRCVIPCINAKISHDLLKIYLSTIQLVYESFTNAIGLVSSGSLSLKDLQEGRNDHLKTNHPEVSDYKQQKQEK